MGQGADVGGFSSGDFGAGASFAPSAEFPSGSAVSGSETSGLDFGGGGSGILGMLKGLLSDPDKLKLLGSLLTSTGAAVGASKKSQATAQQLGLPELMRQATAPRHDFQAQDIASQFAVHPVVAAEILRNLGIG